MDDITIRRELAKYPFYHVIPLTDTISTPGWDHPVIRRNQEMVLRALGRLDLRGKRVLDVGCRDGLFSFAAERLEAAEVIGIDNDVSTGAVEFLIPFFGSQVRMFEMNLYDLTPAEFGRFDVVICAGVLYHLRFPMWGLQKLKDVLEPDGTLLLETAVVHDDHPHALMYCPVGADSPYEPTSCTFFNVKGLADTLASLGFDTPLIDFLHSEPRHLNRLWPRFKRRVRALLGRDRQLVVDRAALTCRAAAVSPAVAGARVLDYWHGTHRVHTVHQGKLDE